MRSAAILVDGSNMCAAMKALGFTVDWGKVVSLLENDMPVHKAMYFTATKSPFDTSSIRPLLDYLGNNGWVIKQKPVSVYRNKNGETKIKGNVDVEIAVEAMKLADKVTDIMLFTGDGDFVPLVQALQDKGVKVTVVSTRKCSPSMVNELLVRCCDVFIDLYHKRRDIERTR